MPASIPFVAVGPMIKQYLARGCCAGSLNLGELNLLTADQPHPPYCLVAPLAPLTHPGHIPNPLPFDWMKPHSVVIRLSSAALRDAGTNGVSVTANVPGAFDPPTGAA